ncbi:ABC transporter ATP-binding protein [Microbacterium sp. NPDC019599]|uniref:ABC transporter ATP-binding protein n=1 Tax=Microbacterium sp. NPDC019599 TaxID=3154690 RepID=UPI0033D62A67
MPEPHIELRHVRREFRGGAGVHGVDLSIAAGEVHALVGLNGAGKTTLMRLMLGMLRPTAGEVLIDGIRIDGLPTTAWARVGQLVENALANGELDVRSNLRLAARLHGASRGQATVIADAAIDELHLARYARVRARRLSLGNRQRLGLAAAIQHDPNLIVLDEPTNGLDPAGVILLREAITRRAAGGAAVFVSSHHLDEVARIADRISVINHGVLIGTLDPNTVDLERAFFSLVHADDTSRSVA